VRRQAGLKVGLVQAEDRDEEDLYGVAGSLLHSRWTTLPLGILAVLALPLLVQAGLQALHLPGPFAPAVVVGVAAACALSGHVLFVRRA
jgi:hypothetical protein